MRRGTLRYPISELPRGNASPRVTVAGGLVGTLNYLSPEYAQGGEPTFASDVYAVGVLAYEMVTKQLPFLGDSLYEVMKAQLSGEPPIHPSKLSDSCDQILGDLILRAIECDPSKRYHSMREFKGALVEYFQYVPEGIPDKEDQPLPLFEQLKRNEAQYGELPIAEPVEAVVEIMTDGSTAKKRIPTEEYPKPADPLAAFIEEVPIEDDSPIADPQSSPDISENLDITSIEDDGFYPLPKAIKPSLQVHLSSFVTGLMMPFNAAYQLSRISAGYLGRLSPRVSLAIGFIICLILGPIIINIYAPTQPFKR